MDNKTAATYTEADKAAMELHVAELNQFEKTGVPTMNKALQDYAGISIDDNGNVQELPGFNRTRTTNTAAAKAEAASRTRPRTGRISDVAQQAAEKAGFVGDTEGKEGAISQNLANEAVGNVASLASGQATRAEEGLNVQSDQATANAENDLALAQDRRNTLASAASLGVAYGADRAIQNQKKAQDFQKISDANPRTVNGKWGGV